MLNNRKIWYVIVVILLATGIAVAKNQNGLLTLLENKKTETEEIQQPANEESLLSNEYNRKQELLKKYESKNDRKKIDEITEMIKKDSNNAELYFERAELYVVLYEWKKARSDYTNAININGKNVKYYTGRAWTYGETEISKSKEDISKAEEISNSDEDKLLIAKYYEYRKNYDMALEKIKKIKNKNSDYYDELLYIYDETDNIEEIIKNSAEYIKKYPKTESGYRYKAGAYIENDKYDEALKVYDDGIKNIKNSVGLFNCIGSVYYFLEKYDDAIKILDKSIALPLESYETGRAYMLRGKAYEKIGNYKEAEKNYLSAIEINLSDEKNYDRRKLSIECYEKLIELYTESMEREKAAECESKKNEIEEYRNILIAKEPD